VARRGGNGSCAVALTSPLAQAPLSHARGRVGPDSIDPDPSPSPPPCRSAKFTNVDILNCRAEYDLAAGLAALLVKNLQLNKCLFAGNTGGGHHRFLLGALCKCFGARRAGRPAVTRTPSNDLPLPVRAATSDVSLP
jgi:hypothetical protein